MTITFDREGVHGDIADQIALLESLIADLKRIQQLEQPTAEQFEAAPIIDHYRFGVRFDVCLTGHAVGHPRLGDKNIATSSIWVFAPEFDWARTLSRYYRLGRPAGQEPQA